MSSMPMELDELFDDNSPMVNPTNTADEHDKSFDQVEEKIGKYFG